MELAQRYLRGTVGEQDQEPWQDAEISQDQPHITLSIFFQNGSLIEVSQAAFGKAPQTE